MIKHFLSTEDWSLNELNGLIDTAVHLKKNPHNKALENKSMALLFFNPSMRTRASFELGMQQLGGVALVLQPGQGAWGIEFDAGALMTGDAEEHISEVAQVLSRYVDIIGMRAFPAFKDWPKERQDAPIKALAKYATVPVVNMETIVHPCQELALMMTLREQFESFRDKKFLLTWVPHPKPLNTAVANSALMIASKCGFDVTLLIPEDAYLPDARYLDFAQQQCNVHGSELKITHNIDSAYQSSHFVYAKSWGALPLYGQPAAQSVLNAQYTHFMVDEDKMAKTHAAKFSHCLPLRRNVKASDAVLDASYCVAIDEAENRLHTQKALLLKLLGSAAPGGAA